MTTLADLPAIEIRGAAHACYSIRDRDQRRAALDAVAARFKGRMPVNGVSVSTIVPETGTLGSRHYRFHRLNGKRCTERAARAALAELM